LQFSRSFCKVCHLYLLTADKCRYYYDNIVVFGQTADECLKQRINFLGCKIENGQIWPGEEKIKAVKNFPMFIGKEFLKSLLRFIAKPLTQLLKKMLFLK